LSQAAAVVFDLTDPSSLEEAKVWLQQVEAHCGERLPKVLLGNKLDLLDQGGQKTVLEYFKP
jgi:GTPase SAR1 family protein